MLLALGMLFLVLAGILAGFALGRAAREDEFVFNFNEEGADERRS